MWHSTLRPGDIVHIGPIQVQFLLSNRFKIAASEVALELNEPLQLTPEISIVVTELYPPRLQVRAPRSVTISKTEAEALEGSGLLDRRREA
jgi:hypothetical protein